MELEYIIVDVLVIRLIFKIFFFIDLVVNYSIVISWLNFFFKIWLVNSWGWLEFVEFGDKKYDI